MLLAYVGPETMLPVIVVLTAITGLLLYPLPAFIAFRRGHQNAAAILALNLLLGWTFLGWVAALVWSLTVVEKRVPGRDV